MLAQVIASAPSGQILMSETISVDAGVDLMRHACEIGLEGIVAKLVDAPYRAGRQESWIKVRCLEGPELPRDRLRAGEAELDRSDPSGAARGRRALRRQGGDRVHDEERSKRAEGT
jgi:hypothetical protein